MSLLDRLISSPRYFSILTASVTTAMIVVGAME